MIRVAQYQDIKIITRLGSLLLNNFVTSYDLNSYINDEKYIILVNEDELVNAFMIVFKNVDCYELEVIYVCEENRSNGIATKLLNYFISNYLQKDDIIFLEVAVNNIKAIKLYEKFNFEIISIRKKYYNGIDAYVMKKVI